MTSDKIRFFADEHVAPAVVAGLRRRDVQIQTVQETGLLGATDKALLDYALENNLVIFTQDVDFLRLHAEGIDHSGIVYASQHTPVGVLVRGLMLIYQVLDGGEMKSHIEFL